MRTLGVISIVWKGRNIPVEKGAKLKLGGMKNNPVVYGRKVGRAQEFVQSEVTATTAFEEGQVFADLYDEEEGELQVGCDTGQTYTFTDAFMTERSELTGGEGGKAELKWAAGDYQEVLS